MASSQDTEITLGTGKLLFLFFLLVAICSGFFSMGYLLGRKSDSGVTTASAAAATTLHTAPNGAKPGGSAQTPPMTFYKAVEQKDASSELTPAAASAAKTDAPTSAPTSAADPAAANPADSVATLPAPGYFVQVAAVSKQEAAEALVDAVKQGQWRWYCRNEVAIRKLVKTLRTKL